MDALLSMINFVPLARACAILIFFLREGKHYVKAPLNIALALVVGGWVTRGSVEPGRLSLVLLGK